jgi:hypothetical protein
MYNGQHYNGAMTLDAIVMMRFPSDVKAALQAAAKSERRSMSNLALAVLESWLVKQGYLKPDRPAPRRGSGRARRTP